MIGPQLFSSLVGRASQSGEKSNVVSVLIALIGVLLTILVVLVIYHAPVWVVAPILITALALCIFFAYAYLYCLKTDPDLLRSEKMIIQKLAIEKRVVGDSSSGQHIEEITTGAPFGVGLQDTLQIGKNDTVTK